MLSLWSTRLVKELSAHVRIWRHSTNVSLSWGIERSVVILGWLLAELLMHGVLVVVRLSLRVIIRVMRLLLLVRLTICALSFILEVRTWIIGLLLEVMTIISAIMVL